MPIINHDEALEVPWRPKYRRWEVASDKDGITSTLSRSSVAVGGGAPLHYHESDELIVILEGTLEVTLGDEVRLVGPNHTIAIPPHVPHGFTSVGPGEARLIVFFPVVDPFLDTTYL